MGEGKFAQRALVKAVGTALQDENLVGQDMAVATLGRRFHVRWHDLCLADSCDSNRNEFRMKAR